jgi:hypothetical protein
MLGLGNLSLSCNWLLLLLLPIIIIIIIIIIVVIVIIIAVTVVGWDRMRVGSVPVEVPEDGGE